jgi:uncharacterized membrane protein YebE (DUF533 family)
MPVDKQLKGMLARIFSDGQVDDAERNELRTRLSSGTLPAADAQATMLEFLNATYRHAMADGVLSDAEKARLRSIILELELPNACVPEEVKQAIR